MRRTLMTPIFTIHAGEYLVGTHLERTFQGCRVWIPSKDSGIDLLLTDESCSRAVSLQVKYSRDYTDSASADPRRHSVTRSTFITVKREKLVASPARYWIIVLHSFATKDPRFLVITPEELLKRIETHHGRRASYILYFNVVGETKCWEMRAPRAEIKASLDAGTIAQSRDFTDTLDKWSQIRNELFPNQGAEANGRAAEQLSAIVVADRGGCRA
jgi:hypothetical protein